jgi:hypothetical protein
MPEPRAGSVNRQKGHQGGDNEASWCSSNISRIEVENRMAPCAKGRA